MITKQDLEVLRRPFPSDATGVKIQSLSKDKTKALLVQYLSHSDVMSRLDEVDTEWMFLIRSTQIQGDLVVVNAALSLKGVTRENYGEGEDYKSACSDALKRCAMMFCVGRYLYDQEMAWVDYNESRDRYRSWTLEDLPKSKRTAQPAKSPIVEKVKAAEKTISSNGKSRYSCPPGLSGYVIRRGVLCGQTLGEVDPKVVLQEYNRAKVIQPLTPERKEVLDAFETYLFANGLMEVK